jgi:hypothetical protein
MASQIKQYLLSQTCYYIYRKYSYIILEVITKISCRIHGIRVKCDTSAASALLLRKTCCCGSVCSDFCRLRQSNQICLHKFQMCVAMFTWLILVTPRRTYHVESISQIHYIHFIQFYLVCTPGKILFKNY